MSDKTFDNILVVIVILLYSTFSTQTMRNDEFTCTDKTYAILGMISNGYCFCKQDSKPYPSINCKADPTLPKSLRNIAHYGFNDVKQIELLDFYPEENSLDIRALKEFPQLRWLKFSEKAYNTKYKYNPVHLIFENTTFYGCNKISELHINIPLRSTNITEIVKPLEQLRVLDLNKTENIGYTNMLQTVHIVPIEARVLGFGHFQTLGNEGYSGKLSIKDFFPGTRPDLEVIDLSNNGFQIITAGWFEAAPNLRYLDISDNFLRGDLNTPCIIELLIHPKLETLLSDHQGIYQQLDRDTVRIETYRGAGRTETYRETFRTEIYPDTVMDGKMLQCINELTHNNISVLLTNRTIYCAVVRTCFFASWANLSCAYLPPLNDIIDFNCKFWIKFPIGPHLQTISFMQSQIDPTHAIYGQYWDVGSTLCIAKNNLKKINLSKNYFWTNTAGFMSYLVFHGARGLDQLEEMILNTNHLIWIGMYGSVMERPSVKHLDLSNTLFKVWYIPRFTDFSFCSDTGFINLERLDLSMSEQLGATVTPSRIIENCSHISHVTLSGRRNDSAQLFLSLGGTTGLNFLDLSSTNIESISNQFARELDLADNLTINLSGNPIACNCKSLDFIKWVQNTKVGIENLDQLTCYGTNGLTFLSKVKYNNLRNKCLHIELIAITLATCLCTAIFMTLSIVLYRYRFRIQYKWIKLQRNFGCRKEQFENEDSTYKYDFDAFVSYSSEDRFWVHNVLMKTLEEKYAFKLVIHYRDILFGENVQNAIDDRMSRSREFILVMTQNFLESVWCQTEMEEAYRESLRRHRNLAVIVLGDIPQVIHNPTARVILERYNYLQWKVTGKQERAEEKLFWAKLVHHLYGSRGCCSCCLPVGPAALSYREVIAFTQDVEQNDLRAETNPSNRAGVEQRIDSVGDSVGSVSSFNETLSLSTEFQP